MLPSIEECGKLERMAPAAHLAKIFGMVRTPPRTIAVVGSSGNLRYRGHGRLIDEHDVVIRVNGATTAGYEHDVGKASSLALSSQFRVCWETGCNDAWRRGQFTGGNVLAVVSHNLRGGTGKLPYGVSVDHATLDSGWMETQRRTLEEASSEEWLQGWPSTGWFALSFGIALAGHYNANVSAFGFGACPSCRKYDDVSHRVSNPGSSA